MTDQPPRDVSAATFEPHLGTEFALRLGGDEFPALRLEDVARYPSRPTAPRAEPFGLVFSGPQPALAQRTYALGHAALGTLDVFLVPIGLDATGRVRYEAVFN